MNNRKHILASLVFGIFGFTILNGCSVGSKIIVSAREVQYPVSYTNSFYDHQNRLIEAGDYSNVHELNFRFTKWGVHSLIEIQNSEDISNRLNAIIEQYDGDAIVNLSISVNNPSGKNGLMWVSKTISIASSGLFALLAITDPNPEYTAVAVGSGLVSLFIPGAAEIKIEGTVIRFNNRPPNLLNQDY